MTTRRIASERRLYTPLWLFFSFFALGGCLYDELAEPAPAPPALPSLACSPFIKTGYTERLSYFPGEKMKVFLESKEASELCRLTLFNLKGDSVYSTASVLPLTPPIPVNASENGFDLPLAVEFFVPSLGSGIYMIENRIPFVIKSPDPVDIVVVYPSNTANAYANSGGTSLYSPLTVRPPAVSFHRPIPLASLAEFCLKWFNSLEEFEIGYVTDLDMDNYESISQAKVLVIPGHSEYWTRQARLNFDRFVDGGRHALILSGNTMWWQVRYSEDLSQMICYKDKQADPVQDELFKTTNWNDPSLGLSILSSIGAHFPLGGYGRQNDNGWNGYKVVSPTSPLFEGLDYRKGDIISLPSLEYDGAPLSGFDSEGNPVIDAAALGFEKVELLGFDRGFRVHETTATFIVFKKTSTSGTVINTSTTDWCSSYGMGGSSGAAIKKITYNALSKLVNNRTVFSE